MVELTRRRSLKISNSLYPMHQQQSPTIDYDYQQRSSSDPCFSCQDASVHPWLNLISSGILLEHSNNDVTMYLDDEMCEILQWTPASGGAGPLSTILRHNIKIRSLSNFNNASNGVSILVTIMDMDQLYSYFVSSQSHRNTAAVVVIASLYYSKSLDNTEEQKSKHHQIQSLFTTSNDDNTIVTITHFPCHIAPITSSVFTIPHLESLTTITENYSKKELKKVATALADTLFINSRLNIKDCIYTIGESAVKVGHTLQHMLSEMQSELTMSELETEYQANGASLLIIDRKNYSNSTTSSSLMDTVLKNYAANNSTKYDEIMSVAHPDDPIATNILHSLISLPAKDALRALDVVIKKIVRKECKTIPSKKATGAARERGRDVVRRWLSFLIENVSPEVLFTYKSVIAIANAVLYSLDNATSVMKDESSSILEQAKSISLQINEKKNWGEVVELIVNAFFACCRTTTYEDDEDTIDFVFAILNQAIVEYCNSTRGGSDDCPLLVNDDDSWNEIENDDAWETENENRQSSCSVVDLQDKIQAFLKEIYNTARVSSSTTPVPSVVIEGILQPVSSSTSFKHVVDASEQFTKAGIDLLKSGFSRFGFGSNDNDSSSSSSSSGNTKNVKHHPMNNPTVILFVIGGITCAEIQEIKAFVENYQGTTTTTRGNYHLIVGTTSLRPDQVLLKKFANS